MPCHVRENGIIVGFQIFVAGILLGHRAAVSAHGIGFVVQLSGGAAKAHSDLPHDELSGGVAGVGVLARLQAHSVRISVGQCKLEQILLILRQPLILISVACIGGACIFRIVRQRDASLDAEAVYIVLTVYPIGFVSGEAAALGGIIVHPAEIGAEALIEVDVVCSTQPVGGGEGIAFLVGEGVIPTNMAVVQIHRHIGGRGGQRQKCCEQHNDGKQCRHHSLCFGFHRDSSIQFGVKKECRGFHDILMRVIILYQPYITA